MQNNNIAPWSNSETAPVTSQAVSAPSIFEYGDRSVRTLMIDGEPWFVASDVAKILGYRNGPDMTRRLDSEDKGTRSVRTPGGPQPMTVISEPGLYVAVLGSQVEGARAFKQWVTREVLPSIRKTGSYGAAKAPELTGAELMAKALIEAQSTIEAREAELEQARPKVDVYDSYLTAEGALTVGDTAKKLIGAGIDTGQNKLHRTLREIGWTFKRGGTPIRANQNAVKEGNLVMSEVGRFTDWTTGVTHINEQVQVTPKGRVKLYEILGGSDLDTSTSL